MEIVIKGLMIIWASKCHQNISLVVCDGYVKYEPAEVDRYLDEIPVFLILDMVVQNKKYRNSVSISSLTGKCAA